MSISLRFDNPPGAALGFARALLLRRPGLTEGEQLGRFEARLGPLSVDPVRLDRYRRLCGFEDGDTLPLTFPFVLAAPVHLALLTHRSFPLPTLGLVHVEQSITQQRSIPSDAALEFRCWVEGIEPARSGVTFELHTHGVLDGAPVWHGITKTLCRTDTNRGTPASRSVETPPPERRLDVTRWNVPEDMGRRYGRVAGDRNPIHLYPWTAKMFGFRRAIVHGMWTMGRVAAALPLEEAGVCLTAHFRRPIFLPSEVDFVVERGADGSLGYAVWQPGSDKVHMHGRLSSI